MNLTNPNFNLILDPPNSNYYKILFGLPSFRDERLHHLKLYKIQQRVFNPESIPRKKKTSLYQVSQRHLELWIEDSFVNIFDQPAFESLAFAWSRAQSANIPFRDACNVYFNNNQLDIAPIKAHATLTEISHIGINLYDNKNVPELWYKQTRDKNNNNHKERLYSLRRWSLELLLRLKNLMFNYTVATESLIKFIRTRLFRWHLYLTLREEEIYIRIFTRLNLDFFTICTVVIFFSASFSSFPLPLPPSPFIFPFLFYFFFFFILFSRFL